MKNKSYFTKYLPVKGEIKEGSWYIDPNGKAKQALNLHEKIPDWVKKRVKGINSKDDILNKSCKLAKLFLCSKDVKIGDRVYANNGAAYKNYELEEFILISKAENDEWIGTYVYPDDEIQIKGKEKLGWSSIYNPFKILGEISSESKWVTEGMEFDESEVKPEYIEKINNFETDMDWTEAEYDIHILHYKIKCPTCKTFH